MRKLRHSKGRSYTGYNPERIESNMLAAKKNSKDTQVSLRFDTQEELPRADVQTHLRVLKPDNDFKCLQQSDKESSVILFNALSNTLGRDRGDSNVFNEGHNYNVDSECGKFREST